MLHGGCHARLETLTWAGAAAPWQRPGQRGSEPGGARITHVLRVHVLDYTRAMCVVVNSSCVSTVNSCRDFYARVPSPAEGQAS